MLPKQAMKQIRKCEGEKINEMKISGGKGLKGISEKGKRSKRNSDRCGERAREIDAFSKILYDNS